MKPLFHPNASDITVESVLHALADPVRVRILAEIVKAECPQICSHFIELDNRKLPKSSLSQHFKILREAGLIRSERVGVEMRNTPRCDEVSEPIGKMVEAIFEAYMAQNKKAKKKR